MSTQANTQVDMSDNQIAQGYNQEYLKLSAKRMLAFCLAYSALQLISILFRIGFASYPSGSVETINFVSLGMTTVNILALCVGVIFCVLFVVINRGSIRNPRTQKLLMQAALFVCTCFQLALCFYELNFSYLLHNFIVFVILLGIIPIQPRIQSTIYIVGFAVLCYISFMWFPYAGTLPMGGEAASVFAGKGPIAFVDMASFTGTMIVIPVVVLASLAASWLNLSLTKKNIMAKLQLEMREEELEASVEERVAEYKEKARVAEAADLAKTRFLTRVSHEMRTSMNTISGITFLGREAQNEASKEDHLAAIEQALSKLNQVVDDIIIATKNELDVESDTLIRDIDLLKADAAVPVMPPERVETPDLTGHNILIVEDIEVNRLILREFLKETKANIEEAENGQEAVDMFAASPEGYYSMVYMDLLMPVMNGHDATRAIRKMVRSDAMSTPIVAVSANAFRADIEASLAAGMDAHIAKPIKQATIFSSLIERLL